MPKVCLLDPSFVALLAFQDEVVTRDQALAHGMTVGAIKHRLTVGKWHLLLPNVYLSHPGEPCRRQLLISALLYAGEGAAIDGADACRFHGVRAVPLRDDRVFVVAPFGSATRSTAFVVVRRTTVPFVTVATERLRYVDPATAVIAATRRMGSRRAVLAALSEALQRRTTTYDELLQANRVGTPRNRRLADAALADLRSGTRSAPEVDFQRLVTQSKALPEPGYNVWLQLPGRRVVCVDALFESSAVVHETNGRVAHEREDLFEDMQDRHDALTAAGFTVLHNPPSRIRDRGREVLVQVERCHAMYDGRGLPPGVCKLTIAS
jgi:hypothetical protein